MDRIAQLLQQIADLTLENRRLKDLLVKNSISFDLNSNHEVLADTSLNKNSEAPSLSYPTTENFNLFISMFKGRSDVFSLRSARPDPKTGKYNYYVQKDYSSPNKPNRSLTNYELLAHLKGSKSDCSDVVGLYPVLPNETCFFLVFDFDDHNNEGEQNLKDEVSALRKTCEEQAIGHLVERSRSGNGYHIWFFFEEALPVYIVREFGSALLLKSSEKDSLTNFRTFDRMIPASDHLPTNRKTGEKGIGNMVALPLQGQALKQGNSTFIDKNWQAYKDQWQVLKNTQKISLELLEQKIAEWGTLRVPDRTEEDDTPWESKNSIFHPEDIDGKIQIVLANRLYIDKTNLRPCIQNQLRRLAASNNPEFYKKQAMGFSVFKIPRIVYSGEDISHFICLPRGLKDELLEKLDNAKIGYELTEKRNKGHKIKVKFKGKLYPEQKLAAEKMLEHDGGVLCAATAFGKTVLGAYLISKRKVNTLILVHNYEILKNWQHDLNNFLDINHDLPEKFTKKGRKKKLKSLIGVFKSTSDTTTNIIDIAMVSSLGKPGEINELVKNYGMVIMDECHHSPTRTADGVLREINAKYLYGLTATARRSDGLSKQIFMLLGPKRYEYTAKDRAKKTNFDYIVYPILTKYTTDKKEIYEINAELIMNEKRNQQIISDAINCVKNGKFPIVITRFKNHAEYLYREIKRCIPNTFILTGGRKNENVLERINGLSNSDSFILVATGQYIGEGFNLPRLDTLILAAPSSFRNIIEQYAGRINRDYAGKNEVVIMDYVDENVPMLMNMYRRRKTAYRSIGYRIEADKN